MDVILFRHDKPENDQRHENDLGSFARIFNQEMVYSLRSEGY